MINEYSFPFKKMKIKKGKKEKKYFPKIETNFRVSKND